MGTLNGRVALVTGSTRGVGRAIAERLVTEGAEVVVHGRDEGMAASVATEIGAALGVSGEASDADAVHRLCVRVLDEVGPIDIVVNNAGTSTPNLFLDSTDEEWDRLLAVNLLGPRNVLRAVLPGMQERGWGRILNVTSEAGVRGTPRFSAYAASKGALLALSFTLAQELADSGICVNSFAPLALTDLVRSQMQPDRLDQLVGRGIPSVEENAEVALRLVADDAPTGEVVIMHIGGQPAEVVSASSR
jgi:2-hydroxycyclohexanecarboxyl-CoA dehydrogenase